MRTASPRISVGFPSTRSPICSPSSKPCSLRRACISAERHYSATACPNLHPEVLAATISLIFRVPHLAASRHAQPHAFWSPRCYPKPPGTSQQFLFVLHSLIGTEVRFVPQSEQTQSAISGLGSVTRLLIATVFRRRVLTLVSRSGGRHEYDPDCFTRKNGSTEIQCFCSKRRGNGAVQSCEPCTSPNAITAA